MLKNSGKILKIIALCLLIVFIVMTLIRVYGTMTAFSDEYKDKYSAEAITWAIASFSALILYALGDVVDNVKATKDKLYSKEKEK